MYLLFFVGWATKLYWQIGENKPLPHPGETNEEGRQIKK
jgi:hypothetical protein